MNSEDAERRDQNKGLSKENSEMYGDSPTVLRNVVFSRARKGSFKFYHTVKLVSLTKEEMLKIPRTEEEGIGGSKKDG